MYYICTSIFLWVNFDGSEARVVKQGSLDESKLDDEKDQKYDVFLTHVGAKLKTFSLRETFLRASEAYETTTEKRRF